jgi:hypothetical protein
MKNYLTEWKKFKNKELTETVETAEIAFQNSKAKLEGAKKQKEAAELNLKLAQQEVQANQNMLSVEKAQTSSTATPPGPISATPTIGTMEEADNMSFGGRADGAVGRQPGYAEDIPNANGPKNLALDEDELTEEEIQEVCGSHEGIDESGRPCNVELQYEEVEQERQCNECRDCMMCGLLTEAKYKGRKVPLGKPMRGDVKKFKVFVRDPSTGNIKKVNFGDKKMRIKKNIPARRKSFRARHNCANPGPRTKARYWSCRKW